MEGGKNPQVPPPPRYLYNIKQTFLKFGIFNVNRYTSLLGALGNFPAKKPPFPFASSHITGGDQTILHCNSQVFQKKPQIDKTPVYLLLLFQLLLLGIRELCHAHQSHRLPLLIAEPLEVLL